MYIQICVFMNMYVHASYNLYIIMYMHIACHGTYMFKIICNLVNMYRHVCTVFSDVRTVLPILVQVVWIPDDALHVAEPPLRGLPVVHHHQQSGECIFCILKSCSHILHVAAYYIAYFAYCRQLTTNTSKPAYCCIFICIFICIFCILNCIAYSAYCAYNITYFAY